MTGFSEQCRDIAHLGHAELLTPAPEESLAYFTSLLGLSVVAESDGAWYLRGYGDYEAYCSGVPEESDLSDWPAPAGLA